MVWDLDPQGASTFYFRVEAEVEGGGSGLLAKKKRLARAVRGSDFEGLDLIPADFSYRHLDLQLDARKDPRTRLGDLLKTVESDYDLVLLDCAPSISLTSESVFAAADVLLVPTIPTPLSLRTLEQLAAHLEREGPADLEVWPFFSMVDRRKRLHRETCDTIRDASRHDFTHTAIPYSSEVEQMGLYREPLARFAAGSAATRAFDELWREIADRLQHRAERRAHGDI